MATIRPLIPADLPAVVALAEVAAASRLVGRPLWETVADAAAELEAPGHRAFIVAVDDAGAVVGMAGYRLLPDGEAEVYGPLVAEEGHGIGAWLESRLTTLAGLEGAAELSMLVGLENRSGQAWAEWRGYLRDTEAPELLLTWLYPGELRDVRLGGGLVRAAVPGDFSRVEWLVQESLPGRRKLPVASWLGEAWVVETEGEVAGCLRFEPATAWIDHLCVDPVRRHRGLGALLLSQVVRRESRKVGLAVPLDDTAPVSLVRRLGFRREVPVGRWVKR